MITSKEVFELTKSGSNSEVEGEARCAKSSGPPSHIFGIRGCGAVARATVLVDGAVVAAGTVDIGSGIRGSKLIVASAELAALPAAEVLSLAL